MCLIGFAIDQTTGSFLFAANRDEYYERETEAAHWWGGERTLFAGRDKQAGGTWLAVSRYGRLAALTNFREAGPQRADYNSRGELVTLAADHRLPVDQINRQLLQSVDSYAGYNLLILDWHPDPHSGETTNLQAWYVSNRTDAPVTPLSSGIYGLSNGLLDDPWPKSEQIKRAIEQSSAWPASRRNQFLLGTLTDRRIADNNALPDTGVGITRERELAPAFICTNAGNGYGTRTSAIVQLAETGQIQFSEWTWDTQSQPLSGSTRSMNAQTASAP